MTPAARRIAANARLDNARNALALGLARERCLGAAVDRLVPLLVGRPAVVPHLHRLPVSSGGAA